MADTSYASNATPQPPPAPPLPPSRAGGVFQKFIAPLSFNIGARPHTTQVTQSAAVSPNTTANRISRHLPSQTISHRTGIPIAAVDINKAGTYAILAGQEILKTVLVRDGRVVEDFNLRSGINSYASAHAAKSETANRREYLPAKDVVWSKGDKYDTIIATAALNGRIALYDVSRLNSSRIELAWIREHSGQVNKLDFDPFGGYYLLSGSQDRTVRVWDIREPQSPRHRATINIHQPVRDVRWSPTDAGEFALCTENGIVQRWDLRMPSSALLSINAHEKACYAIDWHPDGRHLLSGGFDKYARVWDFKSENKRQRPTFELRAPQAILNVRWRPPCWSSDLAEKGHWQSAQLATSYTDEDPRIHLWDLRRPLLPFREHDKYNNKPSDFIWASEHFLWSVGSQGMFQQTDMRYASQVQDELPTSASNFMPDGSFVAFSEDTRIRRTSLVEDPAAGFLRIPYDRLSGGTDGAVSRSISDEDEADEGLLTTAVRQRVRKSSRSAKSQGNTPPAVDEFAHIVPLDRSVLNRQGVFNNEQIGINSSINGIAAEASVVEFLAENYSRPMTMEERKTSPFKILEILESAFATNASACDYVSLHRMAQTWRILGAVVIPELKSWADSNRHCRLEMEAKRRASAANVKSSRTQLTVLSHPTLSKAKIMNNLFKGVTESERLNMDVESTSNMTTPIAKPLPDSPASQRHVYGSPFLSTNDAIEPIPPLPPSVVTAHSTAAAASKALLDTASDDSPLSSPEKPRRSNMLSQHHKRSVTDTNIPLAFSARAARPHSPTTLSRSKQDLASVVPLSPRIEIRKQEDRRAAIRDFRAQQRQLFTFDNTVHSPQYGAKDRHDSSESFLMFSASTDSSQRARSLGQSFESPKDRTQGHRDSEEWQPIRHEDTRGLSSMSRSLTSSQEKSSSDSIDLEDGSMHADFPMDDTSRTDFGSDGVKQKSTRPKISAAASMWNIEELQKSESISQSETAASSTSCEFVPLEEVSNNKKLKIYTTNPIRRIVSRADIKIHDVDTIGTSDNIGEDLGSKDYVHSDFRPIDFTTYEPKLPYAWSALPLISHSIAFDMAEGVASAQFSVHLLAHLYPFFFSSSVQVVLQPGVKPPDNVAERLMRPDLSRRIIEGLFLNHYLYLKKVRLYKSMCELRNICEDFGFGSSFRPETPDQGIGGSLKQDPFQLQTSCSQCYSFMQLGAIICQNCGKAKAACPICLRLTSEQHMAGTQGDIVLGTSSSWTFCQSCGHGAHWSCMQEWMSQADAEGECPTRGCGCDCGPGKVHQQRIARQVADAENNEIIRGGRSSTTTKKDPLRASPSPAVDKTRDTLRNTDLTRDSSGDEKLRRSLSGRGGNRGGLSVSGGTSRGTSQSFGRRVRLVTPGEERVPS